MRNALKILSLFFALLFCGAFLLTYSSKALVERAVYEFVVYNIETEFIQYKDKHPTVDTLSEKFSFFKDKYAQEFSTLSELGSAGLQAKIREVLGNICNLKCLESKGHSLSRIEPFNEEGLQAHLLSLKNATLLFAEFVKHKYYHTLAALLTDLRIFTGINTIIFTIIFLLLRKPSYNTEWLLVPSVLILSSTVISIGIYIFGQNWFYTIIYNNYVGYGYLTYVALIFALLCDIVYNSAGVTRVLLEKLGRMLEAIVGCMPVS